MPNSRIRRGRSIASKGGRKGIGKGNAATIPIIFNLKHKQTKANPSPQKYPEQNVEPIPQELHQRQTGFTIHPATSIPVLIARKDVTFQICSEVELPCLVQTITDIRWNVRSLSCRILPQDKRLYVRCLLTPDIEYIPSEAPGECQVIQKEIPWHTLASVEFIRIPEAPVSRENHVYSFRSDVKPDERITHREQRERYAEAPYCRLREWYIVSSEEVRNNLSQSLVALQAKVTLSLEAFQVQSMDLESPVFPLPSKTTTSG